MHLYIIVLVFSEDEIDRDSEDNESLEEHFNTHFNQVRAFLFMLIIMFRTIENFLQRRYINIIINRATKLSFSTDFFFFQEDL